MLDLARRALRAKCTVPLEYDEAFIRPDNTDRLRTLARAFALEIDVARSNRDFARGGPRRRSRPVPGRERLCFGVFGDRIAASGNHPTRFRTNPPVVDVVPPIQMLPAASACFRVGGIGDHAISIPQRNVQWQHERATWESESE